MIELKVIDYKDDSDKNMHKLQLESSGGTVLLFSPKDWNIGIQEQRVNFLDELTILTEGKDYDQIKKMNIGGALYNPVKHEVYIHGKKCTDTILTIPIGGTK